jgi:transcriptional regulator with XRE-family HTH domain
MGTVDRVDAVRLGLAIRALRRRRGWTQHQLGAQSAISQQVISRIERGQAAASTLATLERLTGALGARLEIRTLWQGEHLDRLLDQRHAGLVEAVGRHLVAAGWTTEVEVTFSINGERGSIDLLAFHPAWDHLLVVEVKSVVPDIQAMLAGLDRKHRLGPVIARERRLRLRMTSRLLVLPADRTAWRRVASHYSTFEAALPMRTREVRRWIMQPDRPAAGLLFVPVTRQVGARQRIGRRQARTTLKSPAG